ncbi:MAG TPA: hypothetical protein PK409_09730, partial [Thermosynergistes sp.]|nr:hypothetical protein [Thermosynergistes sp.]
IIPLEGGDEVRLSMQARRQIIWEESKGYNKLYKKEKMGEARLCSSRYRLQSGLFLPSAQEGLKTQKAKI